VATAFVDWLRLPVAVDRRRCLDIGCGTGALTAALVTRLEPTRHLGIDPAAAFVDHARRHSPAGTAFVVADAQALPVRDGDWDLAVSGLALNFVPDPARAVTDAARALGRDGVLAAYVWDYAGEMQLLRRFWDAATALDPAAAELDEGRRFPICQPDALAALWSAAGLQDVETRAVDVPTVFTSFDDYWSPFLGGQGPAPTYVAGLTGDARAALRERLRKTLPTDVDGRIALTARAWAVRGRR
jgi:SAM-dependent methyltransferase